MQKVSVSKGILTASVFFVANPVSAERNYMGCEDKLPGLGYEGVMANIEHVVSNVSNVLFVWCGIDDGVASWAQVGWEKYTNNPYRTYFEYVTETGEEVHGVGSYPPGMGSYEVRRDQASAILVFKINGVILWVVPWTEFDSRRLCIAYYGAEMHNYPSDFVPGTAASPCDFSNVRVVQRDWGLVWPAALAIDWSVATGSIVKWGSGNFYIWDTR